MNQVPSHAPAPAPPAVKQILDEPVEGVTPRNADNLLAKRRPESLVEKVDRFHDSSRGKGRPC